MQADFFNTTSESGATLKEYRAKAGKQERLILNFFALSIRSRFSPSYVHAMLYGDTAPITSVRRAMTSLTKKGLLVKTDEKVDGPYGRPEYLWRLADA